LVNRSDLYTTTDLKKTYFSDFTSNFDRNPVTGFLAMAINEEDAKKLVRNLVLTIQGERFFQPRNGTNAYDLQFEMADSVTISQLEDSIRETIANNLKFVKVLDVVINNNPGNNAVSATIVFSLINNNTPISLVIAMKRVR
jgi:hypothetical protein